MTDLGTQNIQQNLSASPALRAAALKIQHAQEMKQKAETVENYAQIEKAAQEFESVFLAEMLKPMFSPLKPDPLFGGGKGEEVFQGFMIQEYGKMMSDRGGIGLAEHVKAEMIRIQEEAQK